MNTAPANLPLVLIPGLVCDATVWDEQIRAFESDRAVSVVDHGNLDSLAAMARAVLEHAPPKFLLAGHSMGGRVALEVLRLAPERVVRLALLDTSYEPLPAGAAGEAEIAKRRGLLDVANSAGMRAMAIEWARGMVHPDRLHDRAFMERIYEMIERKTPAQFAAQVRALIERPDAGPVLDRIECPTLVLCGRQDYWYPWQRHVEIAARVRNAVLVGIDDCGHMSTMEKPAAVTNAMREWLG